jgi:hypothetical protein
LEEPLYFFFLLPSAESSSNRKKKVSKKKIKKIGKPIKNNFAHRFQKFAKCMKRNKVIL